MTTVAHVKCGNTVGDVGAETEVDRETVNVLVKTVGMQCMVQVSPPVQKMFTAEFRKEKQCLGYM